MIQYDRGGTAMLIPTLTVLTISIAVTAFVNSRLKKHLSVNKAR